MPYLFLCRVCLAGNLKIYYIQNTTLQVIYEKLTSYKLTTDDGRPKAVCYICLSQLQTFSRVVDKAKKSEEILTQLFDSGIKILQETVAILNTGIQQDFSATPVDAFSSQDGAQVTVKQELLPVNEEPMTIMNEQVIKDRTVDTMVDSQAALCRVCLRGDLRTHCISNTKLQAVYKILTSIKLESEAGRPAGVCFVCRSQLLKCRRFIIRSRKSENILTELFRNGIELTQNTIAALNRRMKSTFTISRMQFISHCSHGSACEERAKRDYVQTNTVVELGIAQKDSTQKEKTSKQSEEINVDTTTKQSKMNVDTTAKQSKMNVDTTAKQSTMNVDTTAKQSKMNVETTAKQSTMNVDTTAKQSKMNVDTTAKHSKMNVDTTAKQSKMNVDTTLKQSDEIANTQSTKTTPKPLICNECGYECYSLQRFTSHARLHDRTRPYACDICSFRYSESSYMLRHKRVVHKCHKCGVQYKDVRTMKMHELCSKEKSIKCQKCSKVFRDKIAHQDHYLAAHPGGARPTSFPSRRDLQEHILNLHGRQFPYYTCDICRKQFAYKVNISKHMMFVHMKRKRFECDTCGMVFHSRGSITQHLKTHGKKPYKCSTCSKTFAFKPGLKLHLMNHTGEKPFACHICDKRVRDKYLLKMHVATHDKSRFNCEICKKHFGRNDYLKEHLLTHITGVNNTYTCHICGNEFSLYAQLKIHMYIHKPAYKNRKKKPHETCQICHGQYRSLKNHMRMHTGEKPYNCHVCGKKFSCNGNLSVHMRSHAKSRPYVTCDICNKRFLRSHQLEIHKTTHNEEKPYKCMFCNKCYTHQEILNTHLKRHAGTEKIMYPCDECDKTYTEKRMLDCHKTKYHSTNKKQYFICDFCFKVYTIKEVFIKHIKTHRKRRFSCDTCKQSFREISLLAIHMNEHAADKTYVCALCGRTLGRTTFSRHILFVHNSVKPYACNTCDEGYLQIHKAYYHYLRNHCGERPYSCDICDNSYVRRFSLVKHYRNVHNRHVKF